MMSNLCMYASVVTILSAPKGFLFVGCGSIPPPSSFVVWCYIINSCHEHWTMLVNIGHNIIIIVFSLNCSCFKFVCIGEMHLGSSLLFKFFGAYFHVVSCIHIARYWEVGVVYWYGLGFLHVR